MPHHRHADRGGRQRPRLLRRRVGPAVGARRRPADHHHDRPGKRFAHRAHDRGGRRFALAAGHARRLRLRGQARTCSAASVPASSSSRWKPATSCCGRCRCSTARRSWRCCRTRASSWCSAWTRSRVCRGGGRGTILMGLDTADKLDQAVPIGAAGRAAGVYRNKHTEDILAGSALTPYVGKRARRAGSWTCARSSRCCRRCWAERPGALREHAQSRAMLARDFWEASWRSRSGAPAALAWTGSARSFR